MRSDLFGTNLESATTERFTLQNPACCGSRSTGR